MVDGLGKLGASPQGTERKSTPSPGSCDWRDAKEVL